MASVLSTEEIELLGRLARLDLTPEEITRYAGQLSAVVEYVKQLSEVNTDGVEVRGVTGMVNILAADQPRAAGDLCDVDYQHLLSGAPARENNFILVRAVMGEEVSP
ncbi:aspartyl/glutamyl-tRNA amidotransferase subunit C [Patescibacteria group bacterium]|nr:aspartyl/glutamyl-tRNA amidotransferase subunit C [Patescibacteria group bacterium]